ARRASQPPAAISVATDQTARRRRSSRHKGQSMRSWPTSSGSDVLSIEDDHRREQNAEDVGAADTPVTSKALSWNFRFEDVAPEVHVSSEKVRTQMLEELDTAHNMKHQVQGQRGHGRGGRIIEED